MGQTVLVQTLSYKLPMMTVSISIQRKMPFLFQDYALRIPPSSMFHPSPTHRSSPIPNAKERATGLLGQGKSNTVGGQIIHRVPFPEEGIAQDNEGTSRLGNIKRSKRADARALHLKNIVVWRDGKVVAGEGESQIGEAVTLLTLDGVLTVVGLLRTHLLVAVKQLARHRSLP